MDRILGFGNQMLFLLDADAEKAGRILGFDKQFVFEILWQWLNTAILIFILGFFLYIPVKKILQNRADRIKSQQATTEANFKEAEALKKQYEQKLNNIEKERYEILELARKHSLEKSEQMLAEARNEAATIRQRAKADVDMELDKVRDDMKNQIIEISTLMASRYVKTSMDKETQSKLLAETISDLGDARWLN